MNTRFKPGDPDYLANTKVIQRTQQSKVKDGSWICCLNCMNWNAANKGCELARATPPPEVIIVGCEVWEDEIPF